MIVVLISISTTCNPIEGINLDLDDITGKVENLKIKNNIGYHFIRTSLAIMELLSESNFKLLGS